MPRRDVNDQVRDASFRDRVEMGTDQCACCPRTRCSLVSGFPDCPGLNFVSFFIQSGLHKRERRCRREAVHGSAVALSLVRCQAEQIKVLFL